MIPTELMPESVSISTVRNLTSIGSWECLMKIAIFLVSNAMIRPNERKCNKFASMASNGMGSQAVKSSDITRSAYFRGCSGKSLSVRHPSGEC
jgi:hypothetical protein